MQKMSEAADALTKYMLYGYSWGLSDLNFRLKLREDKACESESVRLIWDRK